MKDIYTDLVNAYEERARLIEKINNHADELVRMAEMPIMQWLKEQNESRQER